MSEVSGAEILPTGTPRRAIVQVGTILGVQKDGNDMRDIVLNAVAEGAASLQARIDIGVPAEAVPLLFPGAGLPAKTPPRPPDGVCIDWEAALAARG